jgi:hypothetical protein
MERPQFSRQCRKRLASLPAHRVFERIISPWDETKLAHADVEQLHLHLARSGVRSEALRALEERPMGVKRRPRARGTRAVFKILALNCKIAPAPRPERMRRAPCPLPARW